MCRISTNSDFHLNGKYNYLYNFKIQFTYDKSYTFLSSSRVKFGTDSIIIHICGIKISVGNLQNQKKEKMKKKKKRVKKNNAKLFKKY